jgi:CheY-like chemotaxis protein
MIDDSDFISEIQHCIKAEDPIKIRVLLNEIDNVSKKVGQRLLFEISRCDDVLSIPLLLDIQTHFPKIAHALPTLNDVLLGKMHTLVNCSSIYQDLNTVEERCCFIEALTEYNGDDLSLFLRKLIAKETDALIIRSILRAMEELRNPEYSVVVADFLYSEDFKLVLQAIVTLGRCVSAEGISALEARAGSDLTLDRKIINSLAIAGSQEAIECLVRLLAKPTAHLRNFARVALVHLKERSVNPLVQALDVSDKDFCILALNTLGETGAPEAVKPIRKFLQTYPEDANIRFAAYESLGLLPVKTGAYTLTDGLSDDVESVRMAAAKAVDHLYDKMFDMGVKNLLEEHEAPELIVEAFLVAECNRVFAGLIEHEPFSSRVYSYFEAENSDGLLTHYESLDPSGKLKQILKTKQVSQQDTGFQVCVVDDSRLLLRIYRKIFSELNVACHLFEFAEAAFEYIKESKPSLVLTDLNMPGMDGIELTRSIREVYSAEQLPIVMVTTQDENSDGAAAKEAGVQQYLNKPFTKEMIGEVIEKFKG